jgi:hypothetical protein
MADKEWVDIKTFYERYLLKEVQAAKLASDETFCKMLGQTALSILAERTRFIDGSWNTSGTSPSITDNYVSVPTDCLGISSVYFGVSGGQQNRLIEKERSWMDLNIPGWQEATAGAPTYFVRSGSVIFFDVPPTGGVITLYGHSDLPAWPKTGSDPNPLAMLPARFQLTPAYYILSEYPVSYENAVEVGRMKSFAQKWAMELQVAETTLVPMRLKKWSY